jgi:hypothetical protein
LYKELSGAAICPGKGGIVLKEKWKWIEGFKGLYKVSDKGRIKSYHKNKEKGFILSGKNNNGYNNITLAKNGKHYYKKIHRIVAKAFIPNPKNKPQVNHIDSDIHNNCVKNLEWVTPKENARYAVKNNPDMIKGIIDYNKYERPNTIQQYSLNGKLLNEFVNAKEAERQTGVCGRNILQVANQKEYKPGKTRKQAGGFLWKIKNESSDKVVGY